LAEGVDLVEKENARRASARDFKYLVDVSLIRTNEGVENLCQRYRNEARTHLSRDRARDERLSTTRRTVQEQPTAQGLTVKLYQLGIAEWGQEGGLQTLLDFLHASYVSKSNVSRLDLNDLV